MKKYIQTIIIVCCSIQFAIGQDPTFTNPLVNPAPTSTTVNGTKICVSFFNNDADPIPYTNSLNAVVLTISTDQMMFDMGAVVNAPQVPWFDWTISCENNCSDPQLVTYTIQGVQNQVIPGKPDLLTEVGGPVCITGTASSTETSTPTSGVGFNANIAATSTRDIDRSNESNTQSTYTYTAALPIKLLNFEAIKIDETAHLKWRTADAEDFSHFEIQRADGAGNFEKIGRIDYQGVDERSGEKDFFFNDTQPHQGDNYYRLSMVDLDGSYDLSEVRRLNFDFKALGLFPNPIHRGVQLQVKTSGELGNVDILDANGKLTKRVTHSGGPLNIPTVDIPAGVYFLRSHQVDEVLKFVVIE